MSRLLHIPSQRSSRSSSKALQTLRLKPGTASSSLWLCLLVAGCACKTPVPVPFQSLAAPQIIDSVRVVTKFEKVKTSIPQDRLQCPNDPAFPKTLATKQILAYATKLLVVADQCRADLAVLGGADP
jgi:hypothetical protein